MEKQEIKWADVAHYYQKSEILIQTNDVGIREMLGAQGTRGVMYATSAHAMLSRWSQHKPRLRAVEDMTEEEARELYQSIMGKEYKIHYDAIHYFGEVHMYTRSASQIQEFIGNPVAWHWLIQRGFDVFGLIESGQAIRKEAQPAAKV